MFWSEVIVLSFCVQDATGATIAVNQDVAGPQGGVGGGDGIDFMEVSRGFRNNLTETKFDAFRVCVRIPLCFASIDLASEAGSHGLVLACFCFVCSAMP